MSAQRYCPRCGALNTPEATNCFACEQMLSDITPPITSAPEGQRLIHQRYRLLRQIGTGGFGAVYKAEDIQLGNRLLAIKEMSPRGLTPAELQEATQAFHQEALLLARLAHPHLPRIYEQFEEGGRWYLVMDFIEGQTLEDYLAQCGGSLPVKEALQLGLQLTDVLGYLHTRQPPIIFRDLKPSNVMRAPDGQVYLIDFGIARLFKPGQARDTIAFGSPGYAAPEQYGKTQTTPRSDIYSLGALLHHLLTGIDPSDKPFRFTPLTIHRPMGLSTLIERMVDMDAEKRPPTMEAIRRDLERLLSVQAPWHTDDDPALTGAYPAYPRTTTTLASPQPLGASLSASPGASSAWPQVQPGQARPSATRPALKIGFRLLLLVLGVGMALVFGPFHFPIGSVSNGPGGDAYSNTPVDTSWTPGTKDTPGVAPVPVYTLAWSPDGKQIASAGGDSTIDVWEVANPQQGMALSTDFTSIYMLAWSPNGRYIAAVGDNNEYQLWDAINGTLIGAYLAGTAAAEALAWSPNSQYLAFACADGTVPVVSALTGDIHVTYIGLLTHINAVAWSPDGTYLAAGGNDGTVRVWKGEAQKPVYTYTDNQAITALVWSPDSKRITSADVGNRVVSWDATTGSNSFNYNDSTNSDGVNALAWSPDGQYLAAANNDTAVRIWMLGNPTPQHYYTKHDNIVRIVAWLPDKNQEIVASGSNDGTVQVWDALTSTTIVTYQQK